MVRRPTARGWQVVSARITYPFQTIELQRPPFTPFQQKKPTGLCTRPLFLPFFLLIFSSKFSCVRHCCYARCRAGRARWEAASASVSTAGHIAAVGRMYQHHHHHTTLLLWPLHCVCTTASAYRGWHLGTKQHLRETPHPLARSASYTGRLP